MNYFSECANFVKQFWRQNHTTGSILPSSRFLGRSLSDGLKGPRGPARILEVGPGTGAVTAQIIRRLLPGDRLDIVELNEHFVRCLESRLEHDPLFRAHADQIRIIHGPVESLTEDSVYDFAISGLPHNNFPTRLVHDIFRVYQRVLKPGGTLSYFEYAGARGVKMLVSGRAERRRLRRVGGVVGGFIRAGQFDREIVLLNVPPAIVRRLRPKPLVAGAATA